MASISKYYKKDKNGNKKQYGWRGQIIAPDGKRIPVYGKTKPIVEEKIKQLNRDIDQLGTILSKNSYTVSEWTYKHLFTTKIHMLSPSTFELYTGIYNNYIKNSKLGAMQISAVKQLHIQEFLNSYPHLSHTSLRKFYLILLSSFNAALSNNLIRMNPVKGVIIPNKNKPTTPIEILSKEEQRRYILATESEKYRLLFLTALFTGMRQGELIALKWENVNLELGIIKIKESVKRSRVYLPDGTYSNQIVTKFPKSKSGSRDLPLPAFLLDEFHKYMSHIQSSDLNRQYVFQTSTGKCLQARNLSTYHKRICKNANISPIRFHALRHTFATRLLEAGENIKTVQTLLGHADVETTLNVYAHVLEDSLKVSAQRQESIFNEIMYNSF